MSLGDAYTLGVRVTGDISDLRRSLSEGNALLAQFANTSAQAMARAATQTGSASASVQRQVNRTVSAHRHMATAAGQAATRYSAEQTRAASVTVRALRNVEDQTKRTEAITVSSANTMMGAFGRLTGYAGLALVAKQVWDIGLGFNEFTQNTEIALTALLGSAGKARAFLGNVLDFARQTPYAFPDLTAQAQQLLTWGFSARQVIPILRAAGDAATTMGKGKEGVDRLVLALGQINTKGRLQSQELLQLSEVGVNGLAILANQAGMTTVEYQKLVSDGLVPADVAISGIVNGLNEGTNGINGQTAAYGGMMEKIKGAGGITATLEPPRVQWRLGSLVSGLVNVVI